MISPRKLDYLRNTPGEKITQEYADFSRQQFKRLGIPVVIAARNEENDLPATLLALADSHEKVTPIVIENGSDDYDRTYEFALKMGAITLNGASHKMDALQTGVRYALNHGDMGRSILFTDADTLVGRNWTKALSPTSANNDDQSHIRYGSVAYAHGEATHVDLIRTGYAFAKDVNAAVRHKRPIGRGANMSIYFAKDDALEEDYMNLPPDLFIAEEEKFADMVESRGGRVSRALGWSALAITRGDRYDSIKTLLQLTGPHSVEARVAQYKQDYGKFTPNK